MKQIIIVFRLFAFLFIWIVLSCNKEIDCCEDDSLIGTWHRDYNDMSRTFTDNNTFIDSTFTDNLFNQLEQVIKGKYKIAGGFIELSDLKYTYIRDTTNLIRSCIFVFPIFVYEIIDNKLYIEEVGIFRPKGHLGYEIYGNWQSNRLIIAYDSKQNPKYLSGSQIVEYKFNKDINIYSINCTDRFGSINLSYSDSASFYFESPYVYDTRLEQSIGRLENGILKMSSRCFGDGYYTKTN